MFFFFNDTATTEIYTLSLHDALPISLALAGGPARSTRRGPCPADHRHGAGLTGRFGVGARSPLLVPAGGPGDPQGSLVRAGRVGRVGADAARRQDARSEERRVGKECRSR